LALLMRDYINRRTYKLSKKFVLKSLKIQRNHFIKWMKNIILIIGFLIICSSISFADVEAPYQTFHNDPNYLTTKMDGFSVLPDKSVTKSASTVIKNANVSIDGVPVSFTDETGYPYIDAIGRTQVPLRAVMEAFGCEVTWFGASNQRIVGMAKGNELVYIAIERKVLFISGWEEPTQIDTVAIIKDGRTYVPIRRILEFFGAKVDWNVETNTVKIDSHPTSNIVKEGTNLLDVVSLQFAQEVARYELTGYAVLDNGYDYKVNFIGGYHSKEKGNISKLAYANPARSYLIDWNGNALANWDGGPIFSYPQMSSYSFTCDINDAQYLAFVVTAASSCPEMDGDFCPPVAENLAGRMVSFSRHFASLRKLAFQNIFDCMIVDNTFSGLAPVQQKAGADFIYDSGRAGAVVIDGIHSRFRKDFCMRSGSL